MLKKLHGKFIIINMSLVITILIIVLGNFTMSISGGWSARPRWP